jgi:hypothetical protein
MNGRVDILDNNPPKPFFLTPEKKNIQYYENNSLVGIQTVTPLSKAFFSEKNFDQIQNMIRYNVYLRSGKKHIIGRQSDTQLQIIMRSIYLQNSKNLQTDIKNQIKELNKLVLDYCVPNILVEVEQYMQYKVSVSKIPEPIPLAVSTNNTDKNQTNDMKQKQFL